MNRSQVIEIVYESLRTLAPPPKTILVAKLGLYLRRQYGYAPLQGSGFSSLKEVLEYLENRGLVHCKANDKHAFCVELPSSPKCASVQSPTVVSDNQQRLRRDIWSAFISEVPYGLRFMHTKSGAVVVGQASAPGALAEWIQIFPIPKLTQQQWARDFLVKHALGSDSSVASAVLSERWYLDLPSRLREIDPSLFVAWNKERTQKTMEEVERWCKENRIPTDSVFYSPHPRVQSRSLELSTTTQIHTTRSVIVDPTIEAEVPTQGDAYLRGKLLQAISSMTTDELLELRVPLKYVASLFLGVEKGISTDPRSSD